MLNRKSEHTLAGLRNISIPKLKQFYGYSTLQTWSCGKSYKGSKILTYNSKVKGTHWKFVVFLKKMGHPRPLFRLFLSLSNKNYNAYNNLF